MSVKEVVKKCLPTKVLENVINYRAEKKFREMKKRVKVLRNQKKLIFLLATPNHGNIGDQAIAFAELQFLKEELKEFHVVEIMYNEYLKWNMKLEAVITPEDIVCYHGGGNMGTEYFECEEVFRDIIIRFSKNRIITFPQTIYYGSSLESQAEFENSKNIYKTHPRLTLVAREKYSYEVMQEAYGQYNKIIMVPDIVLYLQPKQECYKEGVLVCLREDVERSMDEKAHKYIYDVLSRHYATIIKSDTIINEDYISRATRQIVVENKLKEFEKAELIVTDRLHGMVFAYLSNTPCIVLSNYNYKVKGVYEWIRDSKRIVFLQDIKQIEESIYHIKEASDQKVLDKNAFDDLKKIFLER